MMPLRYNVTLEPGQTLLLDENAELYHHQPAVSKHPLGATREISYTRGLLAALIFTVGVNYLMKSSGTPWTYMVTHMRKIKTW